MRKNLTALFIAIAAITLAVGCKGKDKVADDPKAVLTAFFERMSKKDMEGAAKLATKDSKGTLEMMKKAIDMGEKMGKMGDSAKKDDPSEEFKKMKIGDAKIDGDNATVSVSNPGKDDKVVDFPLKKEGGSWKVDFSMATLMKMGMNEAKQTEGLDLNNMMNSDSLKNGLQQLDSLMKDIDPEKLKESMKELEKLKEN
jgi:DNA-directed RNA polymerase specialized sigma54-like protein